MNKRLFTIAILIYAMPFLSLADSVGLKLNENDFVSAKQVSNDGETYLNLKLSKSGKAKFKKVDWDNVDPKVRTDIAGVVKNFKVQEEITGGEIQVGPYLPENAKKVKDEINND